jgi:hypothetical protein
MSKSKISVGRYTVAHEFNGPALMRFDIVTGIFEYAARDTDPADDLQARPCLGEVDLQVGISAPALPSAGVPGYVT